MTEQEKQDDGQSSAAGLETLLTFPARFPIKIMGKNSPLFREAVLEIVKAHIPEKDLLEVNENESKNGKYLAMTVVATFYDKPAIDKVYEALTANEQVIMAL